MSKTTPGDEYTGKSRLHGGEYAGKSGLHGGKNFDSPVESMMRGTRYTSMALYLYEASKNYLH